MLFPNVTRLVLRTGSDATYYYFDKFAKVANVEFKVCDGRSPEELTEMMNYLAPLVSENNVKMIRIVVELASFFPLNYEPELYFKVMNFLRSADVSTEISIGSMTSIFCYHISSSCEYLKELSFEGVILDNYLDPQPPAIVAELLNRCHSLRKLKFSNPTCYQSADCLYLKLESLEELEIGGFAFDISGCPNLKKLIFSSPRASDYGSTLKYLQNSGITELAIKSLSQFSSEEEVQKKDGSSLELMIPPSVLKLTLVSEEQKVPHQNFLPYTVLLPQALESLIITDLHVILPNIHEMTWLEKFHFSCRDYSYFCLIISRLPSTVKELEVTHIIIKNILMFPDPPTEKFSLAHLSKLECLSFSGYGFLHQLKDLPDSVGSLRIKLSLGYTLGREDYCNFDATINFKVGVTHNNFFEQFCFKIFLKGKRRRIMELKLYELFLKQLEDATFRTRLDTFVYCHDDIPDSVNTCQFIRGSGESSLTIHHYTPTPTKRMIDAGVVRMPLTKRYNYVQISK
ncbi:unnamed protein product [Ambrosiozyma monospora]|uniref:Unnamed protein product n=1 Tax=Ambrosiozyma monospora TaxID=43982 RepID=A0A9W6Z556_AMBMO|nr:unnamed protein product [Ambrosiozyma monospora]